MSAPIPGAGLADDAERWLAGLTAIGTTGALDEDARRRVGDWAGQVGSVPAADVAAMIEAGIALIEEHGWVQGLYGLTGVGFSVVGAIEEAAHGSDWDRRRRYRAERAAVMCVQISIALKGAPSAQYLFPSAWNDDLRRGPSDGPLLLAEARELAWRIGGR